MEYFKEIEERVILVGVQMNDGEDTEESLEELSELAKTAGAQTVGTIIQNREAVHPGTYIGKGKIEEVRSLVLAMDANGVICDDELSPAQLNNLERELDCKVMDRTLLILDIFARRAVTSEGKIQVELAQLRYRSARLVGLRESLSRLGGGIGTRNLPVQDVLWGQGRRHRLRGRALAAARLCGGAVPAASRGGHPHGIGHLRRVGRLGRRLPGAGPHGFGFGRLEIRHTGGVPAPLQGGHGKAPGLLPAGGGARSWQRAFPIWRRSSGCPSTICAWRSTRAWASPSPWRGRTTWTRKRWKGWWNS